MCHPEKDQNHHQSLEVVGFVVASPLPPSCLPAKLYSFSTVLGLTISTLSLPCRAMPGATESQDSRAWKAAPEVQHPLLQQDAHIQVAFEALQGEDSALWAACASASIQKCLLTFSFLSPALEPCLMSLGWPLLGGPGWQLGGVVIRLFPLSFTQPPSGNTKTVSAGNCSQNSQSGPRTLLKPRHTLQPLSGGKPSCWKRKPAPVENEEIPRAGDKRMDEAPRHQHCARGWGKFQA